MPTLRALECFLAVLDHGSLTAAARVLHLSQPALSHQVRGLEREIGGPLFQREPRGVRPTRAARAVERDARAALESAGRLVTTGRAAAAGRAGVLRVGCAESLTVPLLTPALRAWSDRGDVSVVLTESSSADDLARQVEQGLLDLAVCPAPSRWDGPVTTLAVEEVVVVSSVQDDPPVLDWADVAAGPVVHYATSNGFGTWLDEQAAAHGVTLRPVTRVRQATTAARLASAGLGRAVVPSTALPPEGHQLARSLRPHLSREILALVADVDDPLASEFAALLSSAPTTGQRHATS